MGLKENRRGAVLWLLLPILLSALIWHGLSHLIGVPSSQDSIITPMIHSLLITFSLVWLLGERIGRRHRLGTWFLALLIFAAMGALLILRIGVGDMALQMMVFWAFMVAVTLVSFTLAGLWNCRKPGPVKFTFKMSLLVIVTALVLIATYGALEFRTNPMATPSMLFEVLMIILAFSGVMLTLLLPVTLLLMIHPFWRKRFEAVMGIPTRRPPVTDEPLRTSPADEQCSQEIDA